MFEKGSYVRVIGCSNIYEIIFSELRCPRAIVRGVTKPHSILYQLMVDLVQVSEEELVLYLY